MFAVFNEMVLFRSFIEKAELERLTYTSKVVSADENPCVMDELVWCVATWQNNTENNLDQNKTKKRKTLKD